MRPSDFAIVSTPKFASAKRRRRRTSSSVHRKRGFLAVTCNLAPSPGLSIRGRQPSHGKFDLTVGELTPIFDNGRMPPTALSLRTWRALVRASCTGSLKFSCDKRSSLRLLRSRTSRDLSAILCGRLIASISMLGGGSFRWSERARSITQILIISTLACCTNFACKIGSKGPVFGSHRVAVLPARRPPRRGDAPDIGRRPPAVAAFNMLVMVLAAVGL